MLDPVTVKTLPNYSAIPITALLDNGLGGNVPFDGTPFNAMMPVNSKSFRVIKVWKRRMMKGFGNITGSSGSSAGATDSVISPANSHEQVKIKVPLPAKLKYDTDSAVYPTNAAPVFCCAFFNNNGSATASQTIDLSVMASSHLYYDDA
jgi:hypothetical protein